MTTPRTRRIKLLLEKNYADSHLKKWYIGS
jgi:hypothetical protein